MIGNLGNETNNRLESLNASKNFIKKPHFAINCTEWEKQYSNYLTIAAFKYVKIELDHHEHITFWDKNNIENQVDKLNINEKYFMKCKSLEITTTYNSCECRHWLSLYLPCRHIFAVRRHYDLSLFSEELCAVRWSKNYYKLTQRAFRKTNDGIDVKETIVSQVCCEKKFNLFESQKQLNYILNDLIHTVSLSCGEYFTKKIKVLEDVNKCFKSGFDIDIKEVDSRIEADYLQLPNISNIYQSSTLWLPENWNFKLESLKKIDFFWRKLSEVIVTQSSVVLMKPARKNVNDSEQLIKLDSNCKVAEVNSPAKVNSIYPKK
ncbi:Protein of unknown function [Cotesia congregata]|uniref:SWIM-type domain-containing protein n=1 Tax=Cotesia congregata TaxID=51543 RepID=A0A8J2HDB6_COTCN|nr:Protein of unknown function [Cotesia congregata]